MTKNITPKRLAKILNRAADKIESGAFCQYAFAQTEDGVTTLYPSMANCFCAQGACGAAAVELKLAEGNTVYDGLYVLDSVTIPGFDKEWRDLPKFNDKPGRRAKTVAKRLRKLAEKYGA